MKKKKPDDEQLNQETQLPNNELEQPLEAALKKTNLLYRFTSDGKKVLQLKNLIRILSAIVLFAILMLLVIYGATIMINNVQAFPVKISNDSSSISLAESSDISTPTTHLDMPVSNTIGAMKSSAIPDDVDSDNGGSHNGELYLAYTFYVRNNQDHEQIINEKINIVSALKNADKALRVRVYRNGTPTTYAAMASDGLPEYGTTPFASDKAVVDDNTTLGANEIIRYTIVIWLEGDDPECANEIQGGSVRLSIIFSGD